MLLENIFSLFKNHRIKELKYLILSNNLEEIRKLKKPRLNIIFENNKIPLIYAVEKRVAVNIIKYLISMTDNICHKDSDGNDAFLYSYYSNEVFSLFHGSYYLQENKGITFVLKALGNEYIISSMLYNYPSYIEYRNTQGENLLMIACREGHFATIKLLLTKESWRLRFSLSDYIEINEKDNFGETALMKVMRNCLSKEIIEILLENGSDLEARDNEGRTALIHGLISEKEYVDSIEFLYLNREDRPIHVLLKHGANGKTIDNFGRNMYFYCSESSIKVLGEYTGLLYDSINPLINARDFYGDTPLTYKLQKGERITHLLNCGANPNATDILGITPIFYMLENPNEQVSWAVHWLQELIDKGANVNHKIFGHYTPIYFAKKLNLKYMVSALINRNADYYNKVMDNDTPIGKAVIANDLERVKAFLVDKNLVHSKNEYKVYLLMIAAAMNNVELIKLLLASRRNSRNFSRNFRLSFCNQWIQSFL